MTTFDLVLLAKHINGIQPFTENWQWVAADTDLNGILDSTDLRSVLNNLGSGVLVVDRRRPL